MKFIVDLRIVSTVFVLSIIAPSAPAAVARAAQSDTQSQCCSAVAKALEAVNRIKTGMLRENVEEEFTQDGGIDFGSETVYTYKKCPLIKIRVGFSPKTDGTAKSNNRLKDVVKSVSKPYIEYPSRD